MTAASTPVLLWLRDVRRCAENADLFHLVGEFDPPMLPLLAADALTTNRAWWSEPTATWVVRTPEALLLLMANGEVTATRAKSKAGALVALQRLVASPIETRVLRE